MQSRKSILDNLIARADQIRLMHAMSHQLGFANSTPNNQASLVTAAAGHHAATTTHNNTHKVLLWYQDSVSQSVLHVKPTFFSNQLMTLTMHATEKSV